MDGQYMTWWTCRIVEIKPIQQEPNRNDSADKAFLAQGGDGGVSNRADNWTHQRSEQGWIEITFPLPRSPAGMTPEPTPDQPTKPLQNLSHWRLFGVKWREKLYFAVRLTFGRRGSPEIFDLQSEALCCCHDLSFLSFPFYSDSLISPYCSVLYILSLLSPLLLSPLDFVTCVSLTSCPGLFSPVFFWPLVSIVLVSSCLCWLIVSSLWIQVYCRMLS